MNQQIVVRRDVGEIRPLMRRKALSPIKYSDAEGADALGTKDKERPVQIEAKYGEKNDWAKDAPLSRSYQLTRSALKTLQIYQYFQTLKVKYILFIFDISMIITCTTYVIL